MYRALTLLAFQNSIDYNDQKAILDTARKTKLELESNFVNEKEYTKVKLDGKDVTDEIRSREVGSAVSIVSKLSGIRKYLVNVQRELIKYGNAVLEGRDTGSVVCPEAILKIYLTANLEERIRRRDLQNKEKGYFQESIMTRDEIITRDKIDSSRKDSPLTVPENGIVIDTSNLSVTEVVKKIKKLYFGRINDKNKTR